ncbi:MAG: hypothetical protein R6V35_03780 [Candidatus Nanohaloarchaea archaeon]
MEEYAKKRVRNIAYSNMTESEFEYTFERAKNVVENYLDRKLFSEDSELDGEARTTENTIEKDFEELSYAVEWARNHPIYEGHLGDLEVKLDLLLSASENNL